MNETLNKISADDLIDSAKLYEIIGIDKEKCNMPFVTQPTTNYRGEITGNPNSCGYFIYDRLEPALIELVRAIVHEKTAPFFNSNITSIKKNVASELNVMVAQSYASNDVDGIADLMKKVGGVHIDKSMNKMKEIVDEISEVLSNKVKLAIIKNQNQNQNQLCRK